jgi:hypothetical protein
MALSSDARELLGLLAYILLENDRPEKAAVLLQAMESLGVASHRELATLALAQLRSGKPDATLNTLDRLALAGGINAPFHLIRSQALQALDRSEEAAAAMRAYLDLRRTPVGHDNQALEMRPTA